MLHKLENGLKVILQENKAAPVVALQVWVNVGSADDPENMSGMAHMVEHMVFKGTARRAEGQIAKEIEGAGGQINAWTSFDQTVFHVILPSRYFSRGLDILADAVQNARFSQDELERERQVILEEIKLGEDSPSKVLARELFATAFHVHPYGRPVIGRLNAVKSINRKQIEKYYQTWYVPSNMTFVIVGNISADEAMHKLSQLFHGSEEHHAPSKKREIEPIQKKLRIAVHHRENQEAYFSLAFHIPSLLDRNTPAFDLAAIILSQGDSSRLVRKVKNEQQLVTDIYAYSYTPIEPGLLIVGGTTTPDKIKSAIQAVSSEIFSLGTSDINSDELRRAKTIIESDTVYQKETVQGQARKLGFFNAVAGSIDFEQEYYRRIADTTSAQVRKAAFQYFKPENISIAVLDPGAKNKEKESSAAIAEVIQSAKALSEQEEQEQVTPSGKVIKITLKNGAKLLVMRDSSVPLVSIRAVWNGGLRYETPANNGINNFLASIITRGTQTRSSNQINEAIENMAGSIGGFSGQNSFGVRLELLSRHWEQGLDIFSDCILNPAFREEEIERERRQILDDIRATQDNLNAVVFQLFNRTFFKQHPYRMDPMGSIDSVSALTRGRMVQYYRKFFRSDNMVLSIVGDIEVEKVQAKFKSIFGARRKLESTIPIIEPEAPPREPREAYVYLNKQQAHLVVGFPGTTLRSRDRYALEVLASILSGQGGRLFQELRDRQGLAYQVGAHSQEGIEPGYFAIYLATSPEKIKPAIQGIEAEIRKIQERPISIAELKRVQKHIVGSYEISLQRKSNMAALLAFNECYGLGYHAYERYADGILAVTTEQLTKVAKKYLVPKRWVVAVVKPEEVTPGVLKQHGENKQAGVSQTTFTSTTKVTLKPRKKAHRTR